MTSSAAAGGPAPAPDPVEIHARAYDRSDAVHLVRALFQEQTRRYGAADPVTADANDYAPPGGCFLVAYLHGQPVGCAGYRPYHPPSTVVEVKKMYVVPAMRRRGLSRLLLAHLEHRAAAAGAVRAIFETGSRSHAALALAQAAGYQPIPSYVPGRDPRINRAFGKALPPLTRALGLPDRRATAR